MPFTLRFERLPHPRCQCFPASPLPLIHRYIMNISLYEIKKRPHDNPAPAEPSPVEDCMGHRNPLLLQPHTAHDEFAHLCCQPLNVSCCLRSNSQCLECSFWSTVALFLQIDVDTSGSSNCRICNEVKLLRMESEVGYEGDSGRMLSDGTARRWQNK